MQYGQFLYKVLPFGVYNGCQVWRLLAGGLVLE
jgi:hypothetical protein